MSASFMRKSGLVRAACLAALSAVLPFGAAQAAELHHIHVATSATSEAVKWYVNHLDCAAVADRPRVVDCGAVDIEFIAKVTLGGSQGTGANHLAFSFPDVVAKMDSLEAIGVRGSGVRLQRFADGSTLESLPGVSPHGFVFDPWGTRIELLQDPVVSGFHHVHLESTNPDAALEWYAQTLDAERARLGTEIDGLKFGDVWVLISPYAEGRPAATDERAINHLGFELAGLDAAAGYLTDQGAEVHGPMVPENARSEAQRVFVFGPDGVLLALVEPGWAGVDDVQVLGEASIADSTPFTAPLTPWGEPDLQGVWTGNASHGIPLERPEELTGSESLTTEEAAARRERGTLGSIWGYEREWRDTTLGYDKNAPSTQVAMVIDPPDGRLPPLTEKGQAAIEKIAYLRANRPLAAGPENLSNYVRCITRGLPSMMMPGVYNNGLQIVQSPGYVAIQKEMIHETRIIPTTEKAPLGEKVTQWLGNSRGHWEGDTLVVEVRGFNGKASYRGAREELTLTERYRRVGPDALDYTFTVNDPTIWTEPWTGMFQFNKDDAQYELVEYACHEGNYGMTNILSAARAREKEANAPSGE